MPSQKHSGAMTAWRYVSALEGVRQKFYRRDGDVPTIGAGYTPIVQGLGKKWYVRDGVADHFDAAGVTLNAEHTKALQNMADALNQKGPAFEKTMADNMKTLAGITLDGGKPLRLFEASRGEYERFAKNAIGTDIYNALPEGRKTALFSMAYQSPAKLAKAGPDLRAHIQAGDWDAAAKRIEQMGADLGDKSRYRSAAALVRDPDMKGHVMVEPGGSLSVIAERNGTTLDALKQANGLTGDNICAGQFLRLPEKTATLTATEDTALAIAPSNLAVLPEAGDARGALLDGPANQAGGPVMEPPQGFWGASPAVGPLKLPDSLAGFEHPVLDKMAQGRRMAAAGELPAMTKAPSPGFGLAEALHGKPFDHVVATKGGDIPLGRPDLLHKTDIDALMRSQPYADARRRQLFERGRGRMIWSQCDCFLEEVRP